MLVDNYPPMDPDSCMSIGISGGCGSDCKLLRTGRCPVEDEMISDYGHPVLEKKPDWLFLIDELVI